ncbi:MAG: hypothetical protein KatS3mg015_2925 [Fimbriimonadales bacterium]|nr:MAG: hypothetical protein KatS3mg015_2925 [Fimbriimonadales bacterium]
MALQYDPVGKRCLGVEQPGLIRLRDYILDRWHGSNLGIYNCRNVRGGRSLSLHAEGRAFDWRATSRDLADQVIGFCIANADTLNIQRVIDYEACQAWTVNSGWKSFNGPSPGGYALHIERNWKGALDSREINMILAPPPPPPPPPVTYGGIEIMLNARVALIPLAHRGFGLFEGHYDAKAPVVECQATIHGPFPEVDNWWEWSIGATVRCQVRGTKVIVTAFCERWREGQPEPSAHVLAVVK